MRWPRHAASFRGDSNPATRIALVAETGPEFASLFCGAVYAGAWPVPLPLPTSFGGKDNYIDQLAVQLASSDPALLLYPAEIDEMGAAAAARQGCEGMSWEDFLSARCARLRPARHPARRHLLSAIFERIDPLSAWRRRDPPVAAQQSFRPFAMAWKSRMATAASAGCRGITTWGWSAACSRRSPTRFRSIISRPRISPAARSHGST